MAVLNENAQLEDWARDTFKGPPQKVLLPRGKKLFKLSKYHPINASKGGAVTQFWSDYDSTSKGDWGWEGLQRMTKHFGVSETEMARVTSAVKLEWNDLTFCWRIILNEPVYAWHGPAKAQHKTGTSGRKLPGMNMQYFIPNLAGYHITVLERLRAK